MQHSHRGLNELDIGIMGELKFPPNSIWCGVMEADSELSSGTAGVDILCFGTGIDEVQSKTDDDNDP